MYDIKWIRENAAAFDTGLGRRGVTDTSSSELLALDDTRRAAIAKAQSSQERRNGLSKEIGKAMGAKDAALAESLKAEVAALKALQPELEAQEKAAKEALDQRLAAIPNIPHDDVPDGADEHGNVVLHTHGEAPEKSGGRLFGANLLKEHFELGEALGQMDFETAAKLSGSRFVVLNSGVARLSRAIGQFMLDMHTEEHGYTEVNPPLMVRDDAMFGTAQLPKFRDDQFGTRRPVPPTLAFKQFFSELAADPSLFVLKGSDGSPVVWDAVEPTRLPALISDFLLDNVGAIEELHNRELAREFGLWLIPTAEVPLTNLVRESILAEEEFPRRYTALTPCFRAEAGSAGRDTRGMLRQHQFEKVELVSITAPDKSREEHERMLVCAEAVLKKLDLHYRVMTLCTGDMGFASQKTYDIEVWLPGQKTYREISSCSVCGDFQARRMDARYRPKEGGAPRFVHTLNGSGTAVGRALIAVMENYQNPDGSITVPDVLVPYMRGVKRVEKA
ncbi:serine--tRNA ligase [Bosea sp. PAMC 26642]|uniref:serine--tRNA ligase n=1 Tax=Bosea sp. (strain PAMC 26642) TaxID=1792307 RepID=UPI0007704769|nr:serine--tRNA ligase [Bosea sp. PAMC 26642]AMJ60221.1 serine--tRNA ligase [Bosea sp. PAMC 26642]